MITMLMGLSIFVFLIILIVLGIPIAFAMITSAIAGIFIWHDGSLLFQLGQIVNEMSSNFLFLVAPLFILMAEFVIVSGMADDAFTAARKWFNWLPGSLAISSIFASSGFAAVSGSSPLTATTIGMVAIPGMAERGYSKQLSAGIIATAGTIGIMIPPSLCMIVYGLLSGTSIGKLFIAGIFPGLLLTLALSAAVIIMVKLNPEIAPKITETISWRERFGSLKRVGPLALLCILVLAAIYGGVATPTEAGAVGAGGSFLFFLINQRFNLEKLPPALIRAAGLTSAILLLMIGGSCMAFILDYIGVPHALVEFILDQNLNRWWILVLINLLLILLGCVLDPMAILVISVPLVFPIVTSLGFDPVWFGIIMTLNVEIGMITPPVGLNLFVLKAVDPSLDIDIVVRGTLPFLLVLLICLVILIAFPQISLWLPGMMT